MSLNRKIKQIKLKTVIIASIKSDICHISDIGIIAPTIKVIRKIISNNVSSFFDFEI